MIDSKLLLLSVLVLNCLADDPVVTIGNASADQWAAHLTRLTRGDMKVHVAMSSNGLITEKHTAQDIQDMLGKVNEIRRKIAKDEKISGSRVLKWDATLSDYAANNLTCTGNLFQNNILRGYRITNNFDHFTADFRKDKFYLTDILKPGTNAIGCATKECIVRDVKYEVLCVMRYNVTAGSMWNSGEAGTGCGDLRNDDGLCNDEQNGASSIVTSFFSLVLFLAVFH